MIKSYYETRNGTGDDASQYPDWLVTALRNLKIAVARGEMHQDTVQDHRNKLMDMFRNGLFPDAQEYIRKKKI